MSRATISGQAAQQGRGKALKALWSTEPSTRSMFAELAQQWGRLAGILENTGKTDK
jgi:hypothetical protein